MSIKYDKKASKLKGIIEADETYFRLSYKGSRNLPNGRAPHKRGTKANLRGLSRYQVCVPCALDRNGGVFSKISNLGKISTIDLDRFYLGKLDSAAILCTDGEKAYRKFAKVNGYKLYQIESGRYKNGIYHINPVNAFHNNLKRFIDKFRGVSTKYLDNYVSWKLSSKMSGDDVMKSIENVTCPIRCVDIARKPSIPV